MKILFICKGNVGRSQMAEALYKKAHPDAEVISAGVQLSGPEQPIGELMPNIKEALDVMNEEGIDTSGYVRESLTEGMVSWADKVILMLQDGIEIPEYLAGSSKLIRWDVPDPKGKDLEFTRNVRDKIKELINTLE